MDKLKDIIDPISGVGAKLISYHVLTRNEMECVENEKSIEKKNVQLLETLLEKSDKDLQLFLVCLAKTGQQHVVNFIRGIDISEMSSFSNATLIVCLKQLRRGFYLLIQFD
jgi:Caspase recruitment domain